MNIGIYRSNPKNQLTTRQQKSIFFKIICLIRRWRRRILIACNGGSFLKRFPAKCPQCRRQSWDPHLLRKQRRADTRSELYRMNHYRCGHCGDLRCTMIWM